MGILSAAVCVLATAVAVSASPAEPRVVLGPVDHGLRISGGQEANLGDFPYQVALFAADNNKFLGSGVLIGPKTVLTAAQCVDGVQGVVQVRAGLVKLDDKAAQVRDVAPEARLVHPNYAAAFADNDIALLTLPYAFDETANVKPIGLLKYSQVGDKVTGRAEVSGWGKTDNAEGSTTSNTLQFVELNIVDNKQCVPDYSSIIIGTKLCASGSSTSSTCAGDVGGPVTQSSGHGVSVKVSLVGLVSLNGWAGCGQGQPVVFTRVSAFYDFIEQNSEVRVPDV